MLRKLALVVSFACLIFVAAMIVSCGSSKTHLGTMCTGGPFNVVGDWQGTIATSTGNQGVTGVINTQGQAVFFDSDSLNSDQASGSVAVLPNITGTCSFSGNATVYNTPGGGGNTTTSSVQGTVNSATSISVTPSGSNSSTFTLSSYTPLSSSVAALSGNLVADDPGQAVLLPLTFTPGTGNNMSFANNAGNCTVSGTFTQEGSSNIFDFSITFTGTVAGCPNPGMVTGFGFESNTDLFALNGSAPGTYLYAMSSTSALVFEIFKQAADADLHTESTHSFAAKPSAFIFR